MTGKKAALFFDIDGTILSISTLTVPESTIKALKLARAKGHEIFISRKDKSITYSSVKKALEEVEKLNGIVSGPKKLGVFGSSYLYPIFKEIGVIKEN